MTVVEIIVVLVCLVIGYWAVSKLFFADNKGPAASAVPPSPPPPSPPLNTAPRWYETLGVAPTASEAEIRRAYQHLVSQYHPDKVETLGQEFKDLAVVKMQQITAAYREATFK